MNKNNTNLIKKDCSVCGDTALGKNFGAVTCESCKAFFRRYAFKTNVLNCRTNEKCVINVQNRKSCKRCRLNKCLAIGMVKGLILKNKDKRCQSSERDGADSTSSSVVPNISTSVDSTIFDPDFDSIIKNCCELSDEEMSKEIMEIEEFLDTCQTNSESEVAKPQKQHNMSVVPVVRPIDTYNKGLNDIELNRLQELSNATNSLNYVFTPSTKNISFSSRKEYYNNEDYRNGIDVSARQFVQFCKKLSSFRDICHDDQIALVKYGYYESGTWLHLGFFNLDEENLVIALNNGSSLSFSLKLLKEDNVKGYNTLINFFKKLSSDCIYDSTLRNLLSAVSLFNPNRPNIKHKELIKFKQQMYLYLLQRYLKEKYGSELISMEKCSHILNSVKELQFLSESQKETEKDYKQFMTPLMREIID